MYIHIYICMCIYIYMYTHMYICMYMYIYTYTHTHIHIHRSNRPRHWIINIWAPHNARLREQNLLPLAIAWFLHGCRRNVYWCICI